MTRIVGIPCRARTVRGHAAVPPTKPRNWRRLMSDPKGLGQEWIKVTPTHGVRLRRLRRSRARLRSLLRLRRARFIREHPTCPSTSSRGICEATLSRVAKRKKAAPAHDAVIPARTHGRRRWTTRPDAIASSRSLSRRNCSSDHTRRRADFGYTWPGRCYSRRPSSRPETRPHWHVHSSRGDDESDARPKRQK